MSDGISDGYQSREQVRCGEQHPSMSAGTGNYKVPNKIAQKRSPKTSYAIF